MMDFSKRMNKILEVNEEDMYAVIQGGVTWSDIKGYLESHHPDLRVGVTWPPPGTGVVPCCLESGFVDLSLLGGCGSDWVNGLEAVLPNGEVVRTGVAVYTGGKYWYSRPPGPDITGLFSGWVGRIGLVTKLAIKLWPKLPRSDYSVVCDNYKHGIELEWKICKAGGPVIGVVDMCDLNNSWTMTLKGWRGFDLGPSPPAGKGVPLDEEAEKEGKGLFGGDFEGLFTICAHTEKQMEANAEVVCKIIREQKGTIWWGLWEQANEATPLNERGETPTFTTFAHCCLADTEK
ncbi:MAG: FAD-binding protein [Candidatus Jordarchaeaceae archaeon]